MKNNNLNTNITEEDKSLIGNKIENLRNDGGDDEILRNRKVDFSGSDLDVPGRNLPNERNRKNAKDEENQLYSFGGDGNGHLEESTR